MKMETKTLETDLALQLLAVTNVPETIVKIMTDSSYDNTACQKGIKLLKTLGWGDGEFWDLIEKTKYQETIFRPAGEYLDLSIHSKSAVLILLEKTNYHWSIAIPAAKVLDFSIFKEEEIIKFMAKSHRSEVYQACWPFIKLKDKTEDELWKLLEQLNFNWLAKPAITPYLKLPEHLLTVIEKSSDSSLEEEAITRQICYQKLCLRQRPWPEIAEMIKNLEYNPYFCQEVIYTTKDVGNIMWLVMATNYNYLVCEAAIEQLENEDLILAIAKQTNYAEKVCSSAIKRLKLESNIYFIWEKGHSNKNITELAIGRLDLINKTEEELIDIILRDKFSDTACVTCAPYLNLDKKSGDEVMNLLKKISYRAKACEVFLSALKLEEKKEEEIFSLLKKADFIQNVGQILIKFIHSENCIMEIIKKVGYHANSDYWMEPLTKILASKNDEEILAILKELNHTINISKIAIKFLKEERNIMEVIIFNKYDKGISKIGAEKLTKKGHKIHVHLEEEKV